MGNLTRDPEIVTTASGFSIADMSIAINRNYMTKDGEKKEETTFVGVKALGKQAETVAQYFKKGDPIFIEGRLAQDSWEDKDTGQKRSKTYVVLDRFEFLKARGDSQSDSYGQQESYTRPEPKPKAPQQEEIDLDEDVPF